ncbi:MAG: response regulator receiver domain, partial [Chthoniobacterales bacterium]
MSHWKMKPGTKFFERSLEVAKRFLQTAVVIDDRAFLSEQIVEATPHAAAEPPTPSTLIPQTQTKDSTGNIQILRATSVRDPSTHSLNAEDVIESFARLGITCSVLKRFPYENPADVGTAHELFEPADILIIDWQTRRSDGSDSYAETLNFLSSAVTDSTRATPQQLRLVMVYTGAIDLFDVAAQVGAKIEAAIGAAPKKDGEFAFEVGPVRVVVLGKPSN